MSFGVIKTGCQVDPNHHVGGAVLFGLVFGLEFTRRLKGQGSHRREQMRKQKQKSGEAGQDGLHINAFFRRV